MNDTELDELLDKWTAPPAPASLRKSVQTGFTLGVKQATGPGWFARRRLLAAAALGIGAVLLLLSRASLLISAPVHIPWSVESEFIDYTSGSPVVVMYSKSYNNGKGQEIVLSKAIPGDPLGTAFRQALDSAGSAWQELARPFLVSADLLEKWQKARAVRRSLPHVYTMWNESFFLPQSAGSASSGCADGSPVGHETILNYATAAIRVPIIYQRTMTVWMAPDLSCFALKLTIEAPQPDGSFRVLSRKQAVKVTLNPAP